MAHPELQQWNARVRMQFHPRLEHMRPRMAEHIAGLHMDAIDRLSRGEFGIRYLELQTLIEEEERRLVASNVPK